MSITDELREYATNDSLHHVSDYLAIADRIDAEHEAQLNDAFETRNSDENLENDGWVRLPKDVDGEYIHIGDVMAYADNTKPMVVVALVPPAVFLTEDGPRYADMCRHAPTVEDVLRECIANVCRSNAQLHEQGCPPLTIEDIDSELDEYINEYAAKLRELVAALADCRNTTCDDCVRWDYPEGGCSLDGVMRELGVEVSDG